MDPLRDEAAGLHGRALDTAHNVGQALATR
jgi:hypothetical protein